MPQTIDLNGTPTTVYTEAELTDARNSAAKAARVEAESTLRGKYDPQVAELTARVSTLEPLSAQVQTITQERDGYKRTLDLSKALKAKGLADTVVDLALGHKSLDGVDIADDAALTAAIAPFVALNPSTTPVIPPKPDPRATGVGGSPTGGTSQPATVAEMEALIKAQPSWVSNPENQALALQLMSRG